MSKTLRLNCWWVLTLDGKRIGEERGLTDSELDSILLHNLDKTTNGTIFYDKTPLDTAQEKIDSIIEDLHSSEIIRTKPKYSTFADINDSPDELETYVQIPNSIGITRAISSLKLKNGDVLVTPMSIDQWKAKKIEEYISGEELIGPDKNTNLQTFRNNNRLSPEKMVDMEEESWKTLTETGTNVHKVFESIFKGDVLNNPGLPDSIFNALVEQINTFKYQLEQKYPDCRFYSEFGIKSKNLSNDVKTILEANGLDSLNGVIDLLIIDSNGNAHIYDYKVSRKKIARDGMSNSEGWDITGNLDIRDLKLWASTKKLSAEYQTEFYRQMLKQYGINVVDVNILPVELNLEYNNNDNPFEVTGISNIHVGYQQGEIIKDPGMRKQGLRSKLVSSFFTAPPTVSTEDIELISSIYDCFFPKNSTITRRENTRSSIEYYKQIDQYVHKLKPDEKGYGDPDKKYRVNFPGINRRVVYCSEDNLNDTLQEFINTQNSAQAEQFLKFADELENIKNGGSEEDLLSLFKRTGNFVNNTFKKYFDNSWTFVKDSGANSIGLFVFKKGNRSEVIVLSAQALRTSQNLGKGTSLLGKTKSDKNVDSRKVLPALTGNMEMIKGMIYISTHQDVFKNYKISEIKCVNPWLGIESTTLNSDLIYNFNELVSQNPVANVSKIDSNLFLDDRVALVKQAEDMIDGLDQLLEDGGNTANIYSEEWFKSKIDLFETKYGKDFDIRAGYQNTPEWNAYVKLREGWNLTKGVRAYTETDKADYITGKFFELNGLMVSSPQFSSSTNIRELGQRIDEFAKEVRKQVFTIGAPIQQAFRKVYDKYGTGSKVFDSWFANREELILKNPDSPEFDGDPVTREALTIFLRTMCQLRHPEFKTETEFEAAKNDDDYYAIPLLEAAASRQLKNLGLWQTIKNKFKEYNTLVEGLFMGQEVEGGMAEYVSQNQELYNKLKYDNMVARNARLNQYGHKMFETDLERVMNAMLVAFCRSNVSKDYIPAIAGLKLSLEYLDSHGSTQDTVNMKNIRKRFDDMVKTKFYGESIVDKKLQPLLKFFNVVKAGFTTLTLSLNMRSFLRESLQGIYTGLARAGVKMYPGITEKWYIEALTYVIQEAPKNFSGVSLLQQLNAVYGMANQSLNQLAGQRRINWAHINHWGKDTAFLTATAPDFMHRMAILVAKMKSDGCFEAHSIDENGVLVYDFKKDKRFEHFINNDTSNENYLKEKSLYLTMIEDFNRAGFRKEDGSMLSAENLDALPQAYTRTEGQSIKNYADFLYGHYDEESKSLLYDTLFASVFLQYKTFLTAKLEQWTMHEGVYNIAQLEQQFDDNGQALYITFYEDSDGTPHKDLILESEYNSLSDDEKSKYRLYYDYTGLPMQGMLQESMKVYKSLLTMDSEKIKEIWSDPTTRAMFKLQIHDLWQMAFMTLLVTFIFGEIADVNEPLNPKKVSAAIRKMGPVENLTYNVITGSMADSQLGNILASFVDRPPTIGALQRFATSSWKVIIGDASMAEWTTRNVGMLRDFQGLASNLKNQ